MSLLQLKINNQDLTLNANKAYISSDSSVGDGTLLLQSTALFAINQVLVVGTIGTEGAEIVRTHASTAPTSTTVTLATNLKQSHSHGSPVYIVMFDQYELSNAPTATGTKTLLTTALGSGLYAVDPESLDTLYNEMQFSSGGYFVRKYNSITSNFSSYSDFIPYSGLGDNTIGSVKERALDQIGEMRSDLITDARLNSALYEGRRTVDQDPRILRWTFRTNFNAVIGQCVSGAWSVAVPSDLRDRNTFKNVLGLTVGPQRRPVVYQDRVRFNQNYLNVAHSTLNGTVTFGATTITLASTHDIATSGSLQVAGTGVGHLHTSISYTGNDRINNVLSGVTGVPSGGYTSGLDVWQNANFFGLPSAYTIDNGTIYFDVPFYDQLDGANITMDYYQDLPVITTDSQTFDEPFYDLYVSWLKWRIKYLKANGKIDRNADPDYQDWNEGVARIVAQETNGQHVNFIPDIEGFLSATQ